MLLERDNALLVLIDVQGRLAESMDNRETLFDNLRRLLAGAAVLDVPLVVTEQNPEKLGPTRPEFADLIQGAPLFTKMAFSCAGCATFIDHLDTRGRRQLILAGIETHVCVFQTAADLLAKGFDVHVVADAVSSRAASNRQLALDRMRTMGASITSTEMALMEMMRDASAPQFRDLLKVIR